MFELNIEKYQFLNEVGTFFQCLSFERIDFMISITTKELEIENDLKRKIEFICDFCNIKLLL